MIAAAAVLLMAATPAVAEDVVPVPVPTAAQGVTVPDFKTKAWIVIDANSGDILAGQNMDEQRPMASTIKMLTALTLLPRLQYDSSYEAKPQETLTEGAHVGVLAGSTYRVDQLLHGMLMRSGNDAAVALADAYGFRRTIEAMNAEAQRVGATSTVAKSPNGLDQTGQVTTAVDLAQIYRVAMQDPRLQQILTVKDAQFPAEPPADPTKARNTFTIYNNDSLLTSDYPGFLGGKGGFTSQAGRTYVAGADRDGRKLVVALLGIGGGTTQTARDLLDWAYANAEQLSPIATMPEVPGPAEVTPVAAGELTGDDVAAMPLDEATQLQLTTIAQSAQQVSVQAADIEVPSAEEIAVAATTTVASAVSAAGGTPVDTAQIIEDAQSLVTQAVTAGNTVALAPTVGTPIGASAIVAGQTTAPVATAADPLAAPEPDRGFFATVLIGLFKAFAWLMLFLGIAVVLLRIRAVRRQQARREAMQRRATQEREPARLP